MQVSSRSVMPDIITGSAPGLKRLDMDQIVPIAALVTNVAAIASLLLVWRQLRLNRRNGRYLALTSLHEQIIGAEMQQSLRAIYAVPPESLREPSDDDELSRIETVLNTYDLIGSRIRMGLIPEPDALQTEWSVVLRLRTQLQPFLEREQDLRPGIPYKPGFIWLAARAEEFRMKHHPSVVVVPFPRTYSGQATPLPKKNETV